MTDISVQKRKSRKRTYSRATRSLIKRLADEIRIARLERRLTQSQAAERIGVARSTYQLIEKGHPGCELGHVFEAASSVGLNLMGSDDDSSKLREAINLRSLALLPKRGASKSVTIDNDF